jgi:hypothetical protein
VLVAVLDLTVLSAAMSTLSFIVLYAVRTAWWRNPVGRTLMTVCMGLSLVLAGTLLTGIGVKTEHSVLLICMRIMTFSIITCGSVGLIRNLLRAPQITARLRGK